MKNMNVIQMKDMHLIEWIEYAHRTIVVDMDLQVLIEENAVLYRGRAIR